VRDHDLTDGWMLLALGYNVSDVGKFHYDVLDLGRTA
jgi:hypothetical protein